MLINNGKLFLLKRSLFLATVKGSKKCTVEITFLLRGEAIKWHILSLEAGVAGPY